MIVLRLDRIRTTGEYILNHKLKYTLNVIEIGEESIIIKEGDQLIEIFDGALFNDNHVLTGLEEIRARGENFIDDIDGRLKDVNRALLFAKEGQEMDELQLRLDKLYAAKIPKFRNRAFKL